MDTTLTTPGQIARPHARRAGFAAATGLAGFLPLLVVGALFARYGHAAPGWGLTVPFLLSLGVSLAVGLGGFLATRALAVDPPVAVLASAGAHVLALFVSYLAAAWLPLRDPYAPAMVLGIGMLLVLLAVDRGAAPGRRVLLLALLVATLAALALLPTPRFLAPALAWLLLPPLTVLAEA